jgi:hypothetical protein
MSCIFATRKLVEITWTGINNETKRIYGSYLMPNVEQSCNKYLPARKPYKRKNIV